MGAGPWAAGSSKSDSRTSGEAGRHALRFPCPPWLAVCGSILSTRCSETYETKTALDESVRPAALVLLPVAARCHPAGRLPGNCWAFKGSQGYLVIKLSLRVQPTAFYLEHIPKTMSPTGSITSAPRNFSVY
ncbi:hypothetical protein CRUP_014260, partial [Coryphaenoides rupestris]